MREKLPMMAFGDLAAHIAAVADASGVSVEITRGTADGFGMSDAATLDVAVADGDVVRIWDECDGDVWLELPAEEVAAAWWRHGRKEASLAEVVIALGEGRYTVEAGVVSVMPRDRKRLTLKDTM